MECGTPGGKSHKSPSPTSLTKLLPSWSTAVMRALPFSMIAHSASTCQWSSRTPPAVSRISTPAMVVEIGNSRTVTCRVQPPLSIRLCAREKEYLNGLTVPLSVEGDHSESGFSAARGRFCAPGLVSFGALWLAGRCACGAACASLGPAMVSAAAAARTAEPTPSTSRLLTFVSRLSMPAMPSPLTQDFVQKTLRYAVDDEIPPPNCRSFRSRSFSTRSEHTARRHRRTSGPDRGGRHAPTADSRHDRRGRDAGPHCLFEGIRRGRSRERSPGYGRDPNPHRVGRQADLRRGRHDAGGFR